MQRKLKRLLPLILLVLTANVGLSTARATTPSDEFGIESDIESDFSDEDDGSFVESTDDTNLGISDEILGTKPSEPKADPRPYTERLKDPTNHRSSGSSGEKIFDWNKHVNESVVPHPYAEKGLIRINKDRTYLYKVEESKQDRAASIHVGMFDPANLSNPDLPGSPNATFSNNYDQSDNPAILIEYEWQPWRSPIGKFGFRVGSGVFVAQGNGHFVNEVNATLVPREVFTFVVLPNTIGAVYRMHIWNKQLFVPYAEGGAIGFAFSEFRDDNAPPKFGGAVGAYAAGGVAFNMTYFDYLSRVQLDREYGINTCYLTVEFRHIQAVTTRYDFTSEYLNGGFLMEF